MTARRPSYSPPTGAHVYPGRAPAGPRTSGSAATALALLECDPEKVLAGPLPGRPGRSAAALARERYREALKVPADLLEFDSPPAAASSATAEDSAAPAQPVLAAAAPSAAPATVSSAIPSGSAPSGLWPGDTVLARYGPRGCFYRARIVRVYSRNGASLADVEWLRPQAGMPEDGLYLSGAGIDFDDIVHRQGLKVDTDLRSAHSSGSLRMGGATAELPQAMAPILPPPPGQTRAGAPTAVGASAGALGDLLDLQGPPNEAADLLSGGPALVPVAAAPAAPAVADLSGTAPMAMPTGMAVSSGPAMHMGAMGANGTWGALGTWGTPHPGALASATGGAGPAVAPAAPAAVPRDPLGAAPLLGVTAAPWPQPAMVGPLQPPAAQPERFGFVSDMISRAADAPAGTGP
mmetsp:Transcript_60176/g.166538  ORF Transcript_60176/g.166538 Transcript_60176/m.166538 type:complete len:407 (-) Transcript_60176:162-1382(-)